MLFIFILLIHGRYKRSNQIPIGKFVLNIIKCPSKSENGSFSIKFAESLSEILPQCYLIELSKQNLMELNFSPKKNYETDRLDAGLFQVYLFPYLG